MIKSNTIKELSDVCNIIISSEVIGDDLDSETIFAFDLTKENFKKSVLQTSSNKVILSPDIFRKFCFCCLRYKNNDFALNRVMQRISRKI